MENLETLPISAVLGLAAILSALSALLAWALAKGQASKRQHETDAQLGHTQSELARVSADIHALRGENECLVAEKSAQAVALGRLESAQEAARLRLETLMQEFTQTRQNLETLRQRELVVREKLQQSQALLGSEQKSAAEYKGLWESSQAELATLRDNHQQLQSDYTELNTTLEQKQLHFAEQLAQLEKSRELLKKDFENLANEILERKGKAFTELNQQSLSNLLNPIQAEMKGFKERVERIHEKDSEQRIQLKAELGHLQKLNKEITEQTDKLTTALQGQKKTQGNWGELMLENVLDSSGLRLGKDYQREVSFTTEEGRQRPDVVVYLPQGKHLVIDAKNSLVAYTRYVNAENELERQQALQEHARAVSDRINELADRDYFRLPGLNSPEIVIMFIPIESAYVEALRYDDTLYQRAIERNVLVATPTTLLTSLNIVRQLWRFEDQSKHTAELAERAERFYTKLNGFLGSMQEVGKKLDSAKVTYDKALGQLYSGRGNLIKQASEFKELGVAVQKELPAELVEKANLELETTLIDGG